MPLVADAAALAGSYLAPLAPVASRAAGPLVGAARRAVLSVLSRVAVGQLVVTDAASNVTTVCGALGPPRDANAKPRSGDAEGDDLLAELRVLRGAFWLRALLFGDMGFAESFMLGEVACEDLTSFFELAPWTLMLTPLQIFIRNRAALANGITFFSPLATLVARIARSANTLANARLHIAAHYDISNSMFAAFLSPDMTYSCACWAPSSGLQTLEDAQRAKLARFVTGARLQRSDHVLEIGSGWGSFAIAAVQATGCRVTTLTLSLEQKTLAEERIAAAGWSDHVDVLLCDYRVLPSPPRGFYDKIVSIEMLEAVGAEYLETYFRCVDRLLKPEGGIAMFQCITIPEARYADYARGNDFIRQYIFPGGHLPTISQLVASIQAGSEGRLIVEEVCNIGSHYAKTLRIWRENFDRNFEQKIRPALLEEHPEMNEEDTEIFRRKWLYYFTYCEAGFRRRILGDHIITVVREGTTAMAEGVPL